jgi:hypothetical protein
MAVTMPAPITLPTPRLKETADPGAALVTQEAVDRRGKLVTADGRVARSGAHVELVRGARDFRLQPARLWDPALNAGDPKRPEVAGHHHRVLGQDLAHDLAPSRAEAGPLR